LEFENSLYLVSLFQSPIPHFMKKILLIIWSLAIGCGTYAQLNFKEAKAYESLSMQNPNWPVAKSGPQVLYDSLLTYSFTSENDSIAASKFIYSYDASFNRTTSLSYRWDKVNSMWKNYGKGEWAYDASGHQTLNASYSWNTAASSWSGTSKFETSFDQAGNQILYAYYSGWNNITNTWVGSNKNESEFGDQKELLKKTNFVWNSSLADWGYQDKEEYQYGDNGKQLLMMGYFWNAEDNTWSTGRKVEDSYNELDSLVTEVTSYWNSYDSSWTSFLKFEFTYDTTTVTRWYNNWNSNSSAWDLTSKRETTRDMNGRTILEIYYKHDVITDLWTGTAKNVTVYDNHGNQTSVISYTWDPVGNNWLEVEKTDSQFDGEDHRIQQITSSWNTGTSAWDVTYRLDVTYNANGDMETLSDYMYDYSIGSRTEYFFNEDGIKVSFKQYDGSYDNWTLFGKGYYYWTPATVTETIDIHPDKGSISIFPNPVGGSFRAAGFEGKATFFIYDIRGQIVFNKEISQNQEIDISYLTEGLYLVKVYSAGGNQQLKLIKR
jgi:hypothetical protein